MMLNIVYLNCKRIWGEIQESSSKVWPKFEPPPKEIFMFESKHRIQEIVDNTEHKQKIHIIVLEKYSCKNGIF